MAAIHPAAVLASTDFLRLGRLRCRHESLGFLSLRFLSVRSLLPGIQANRTGLVPVRHASGIAPPGACRHSRQANGARSGPWRSSAVRKRLRLGDGLAPQGLPETPWRRGGLRLSRHLQPGLRSHAGASRGRGGADPDRSDPVRIGLESPGHAPTSARRRQSRTGMGPGPTGQRLNLKR